MSRGVRVICPECADVVAHHCNTEIRKAVVDLLSWIPEGGFATDKLGDAFMEAGKELGWLEKDAKLEDQINHPFFGSQAWSYCLFGSKDTARSFHSRINTLIRALDIEPAEIEREIETKRQRKEAEEKARLEGIERRETERKQLIAYLQSDAPLEERIVKLDEILRAKIKQLKLKPYGDDDTGYDYLLKALKRYYGGGISHGINRARITKMQGEDFDKTHED
jgi:hypothetical protein